MPLLKSVKIGNLTVDNNVFVAPMAGITDQSFRILTKRFGAGLLFTEMVSVYAVIYKNKETERICKIAENERPVGLQIFGSNPEIIKKAIEIIDGKYRPDVIDLNAGCPVAKVLKSGSGAKLLETPDKIFKIVKAIVEITDLPVTVKMRLGINRSRINIVENALAAQEAGANMITLHPRTAEDRFKNPCKWEYIALIKEKLKIPVCGNGDIKTHNDALRMLEETNCDAVMVGRGAIGNPWLIGDIIDAFRKYPEKHNGSSIDIKERIKIAIEHLRLSCELKGEERGIREMRHILPHYIKGIKNSSKLRNLIVKAESFYEIKEILESVINNE